MAFSRTLTFDQGIPQFSGEAELFDEYSRVEYNRGKVIRVIAFQSDALDCRGGPSASL